MKIMKEKNKQLRDYNRITIYVGQEKRKKLLKQILEYTQASSISEAIFKVLSEFMRERERREKIKREKAAEKTKGIWANNLEVDKAFEEVDKRWQTWKKYYEEHKESLLKKYKGKYIAILNNKVIGSDKDFSRLAQRVYNKYDYRTIYMPFVDTREKIVRIPSPRIKIL